MDTKTERETIIEDMIDKAGLAETLDAIAQVCYAKADHIRYNWQDTETAKPWDKFADKVDGLGCSASNYLVLHK